MLRRLVPICTAALLPFLATGAHAALSLFPTDTEGWIGQGDTEGPLTWSATGGNPGGHVFIDDLTTGGVTYFVAPAAFLGDKSAAIGTNLTFDLQQVYSGQANQFDDSDVILQGGGLTIVYNLPVNPANGAWTSFAVPLSAPGWSLNTLGGVAATPTEFASVLSDLTALRIRAEYQSGPDIGHLDNVSLVPEPASATMLLCGLGLVLVAARSRRLRSRAAT